MQPASSKSSESRFPLILPINKEFVGISHMLQQKKSQRRKISNHHQIVENRVLLLIKQSRRASKGIQEKQRKLESIVNIRKRQEDERIQKQRLRNLREQQKLRLKQIAQENRIKHKISKEETTTKILSKKKDSFLLGKQQTYRSDLHHLQITNEQRRINSVKHQIIQSEKENAKKGIEEFFLNKNQQHIKQYKARMTRQQTRSRQKLESLQHLSRKQLQLISQLEKSQGVENNLEATLEKAQNMDLQQLQKYIIQKPRSRARSISSRKSSKNSLNKTSVQKKYAAYRSPRQSLPKLATDFSRLEHSEIQNIESLTFDGMKQTKKKHRHKKKHSIF